MGSTAAMCQGDPMDPQPLALPPTDTLVAQAEARLRRQRAYARPLAGRPAAARRLERALAEARALLATARPAAAWRRLNVTPLDHDHVTIEQCRLYAPRLAQAAASGHPAGLWLCTLGPLGDLAPAPIGATGGTGAADDPLGHHVAQDLAHQTLHAASRAAHTALEAALPGWQIRRLSLRRAGERLWDAEAVFGLLPLLGPRPLGVTAPDGLALAPPHSLLGLCLLHPPSAASATPQHPTG